MKNGPAIAGLEHDTFESTAVHATVGYTVWLPPGYSASNPALPAIYFLHGAGGDEYSGTGAIVPRIRDAIEQKQLPAVLCVFCNGDHSGYRDDESTGILGESAIVNELVPIIDLKYHTPANRRAVIGFSMGASGAIRFAVKHPDRFSAAVGWGGGYRGSADFARQNLEAIKRRQVGLMMVIGDKDNMKLTEEFVGELAGMGIPYSYEVAPGVSHDFAAYLDRTWPKALVFLASRLRTD